MISFTSLSFHILVDFSELKDDLKLCSPVTKENYKLI